jgi:hypothetical protein
MGIAIAHICYTLTVGGYICIGQYQKPEDNSYYSRVICHSNPVDASKMGVRVCPEKKPE